MGREQETFRFVYQAPFHKTIIRLYVDANNSLWLGTRNGLYRTDNIHNPSSPVCVIPNINVLSLYRDSRGTMWVATFRNGMYKNRERNQPAIYHPKGIRYLQQ